MKKVWCAGVIVIFSVLACAASGPAQTPDYIKLSNIDVSEDAQGVSIKLNSNRPLRTIAYDVKDPPQVILDLLDDTITEVPQELTVNKGGVSRVRVIKDIGRKLEDETSGAYPVDFLVIEMSAPMQYSVSKEGNISRLSIFKKREKAPAVEEKAKGEPAERRTVSLKEEIARAKEEAERESVTTRRTGRGVKKVKKEGKDLFKRPQTKIKSAEEVAISKLEGRQEMLKREIDRLQMRKLQLENIKEAKKVQPQKVKKKAPAAEEKTETVQSSEGAKEQEMASELASTMARERAPAKKVVKKKAEPRKVEKRKEAAAREEMPSQPMRNVPDVWAKSMRDKGYAFQAQGDYGAAAELYQQAIKLDPKYAGAHNDLGVVYEQMGQDEEAIDEYTKALVLDPRYLKAHTNLALLYEKRGEKGKAMFHWKRRAELGAPNDPWTKKAKEKLK